MGDRAQPRVGQRGHGAARGHAAACSSRFRRSRRRRASARRSASRRASTDGGSRCCSRCSTSAPDCRSRSSTCSSTSSAACGCRNRRAISPSPPRSRRACTIARCRHDAVFVGEVGLGGEMRAVSQAERRIAEAANMGMRRVYLAERGVPKRVPRGRRARSACARLPTCFERLFTVSALPQRRDVGVVIVAGGSSTRSRRRRAETVSLGRRQADAAAQPADVHGAPRRRRRSSCVLPREYAADPPPWIFQCDVDRLMVSIGGRTRTESVRERPRRPAGRSERSCSCTTPRARSSATRRSIASSRRCATGRRAIAALPVVDTLKEVDETGRDRAHGRSRVDSGARRRRRDFRAR